MFLVRLQGKFEIDHSWEWKGWPPWPCALIWANIQLTLKRGYKADTWGTNKPQHSIPVEGEELVVKRLSLEMPTLFNSPESCDAWTSFPKLKAWFPRCYGGYTAETAEQSPLVENATRSTVSIRTEETWKEGMCEEPFIFKDSQELGTLPVVTALTTYMGGGLVADLGYNITMAREVISNLQQDKWISRQTRAIFLEIVLFEPATNTFAFVRFTFEYMTTGKIIAYRKVEPLSFYGSGNPTYDTLIYVFYVLLVLLVAFSFYREVMDLRRRRCEYFKDPWSYMEMVLNAATLALIVVFLFKAEYSRRIVQKIQCNPYSRMSFDYVVLWTDVESVLLALVIFLATLKLLRIVRFNEHVSILAWTMRFSRGPLASYAAIFLTQVTAFAILGNLLFGSTKFMYSTMVRTLVNCFEMILGKGVDFAQLEGSYPLIGPLYLFGYNFFVTILVMNFFIAILCDSFAEAQQKSQEGNEDVEVADMMLSQIKKSMKEISGNLRSLVTTSENNHSLKSTYNERDYFLYWVAHLSWMHFTQWTGYLVRKPECNNFQPFHSQEWSILNFPCNLTRNITSHSRKNLAFHSSHRWKMIILPNSHCLAHTFLFKRLGEHICWTWEWKG